MTDLKERLARIMVGYNRMAANPLPPDELKAEGAMAALLKDALKPNLVQTLEGTPCALSTAAPSPISRTAATPLPPPKWR